MRIAICEDLSEDSAFLLDLLSKYLNANSITADVDIFANGELLLNAFLPGKYNILFQDIYMDNNGLTGMQVTEIIRKTDRDIAIIFTTTSSEHAVASYDVNASYYIVKPIEKESLEKAMDKCNIQINRYARTIEILENRQITKIRLRDVCYAEVIQHNIFIHTISGEIKTRTTFKNLNEKLMGSPFISCHRSYIVNLTHVLDMEEKNFVMRNGDKVPISKTYQSESQKAFKEHFWSN